MSSARRTLLTATAAGTLLGALWFVPSANASVDAPVRGAGSTASTAHSTQQGRPASTAVEGSGAGMDAGSGSEAGSVAEVDSEGASASRDGTELAATGSIDTTPYVVGGTLFLAVGAGFVVYSVRREQLSF